MKHALHPLIPTLFALLTLSALGTLSGCRSVQNWMAGRRAVPAPTQAVVSSNAAPGEVLAIVNQNVRKVDSFSTSNATLVGDGLFNLRADIAFKRPNLFRLRGSHAVSGAELDVGRNSELSWMWVRQAEPKVTYYCRNEDYGKCRYIQSLPIDPNWMISALGFGEMDPHVHYTGPFRVDDSRLELRRQETTAAGVKRTIVTVVNRYRGLPDALRVYDQYDMLVAEARVKTYRTDPVTGITCPQSLELNFPKEQDGRGVSLDVHFGTPTLNQISAENTNLWQMPSFPGYPAQNIARMKQTPGP